MNDLRPKKAKPHPISVAPADMMSSPIADSQRKEMKYKHTALITKKVPFIIHIFALIPMLFQLSLFTVLCVIFTAVKLCVLLYI